MNCLNRRKTGGASHQRCGYDDGSKLMGCPVRENTQARKTKNTAHFAKVKPLNCPLLTPDSSTRQTEILCKNLR